MRKNYRVVVCRGVKIEDILFSLPSKGRKDKMKHTEFGLKRL